MMNDSDLCRGCFLSSRTDGRCPRCGYLHDPGAFPTALQPGTVLSKYTLGRVLGKPGGFGITYLSFDSVLQRRLAIKELMPRELVARRPDGATLQVHTREDAETFKNTLASFLKEARLLAQFSHPNVVRVLDYFEANGTAYFAMEYYEGQTLAEYTQRVGGRLKGPEAVSLMLPLLDALGHIHSLSEPILHRDIKPANIYLTKSGTPILLDFGAARATMGQQSRSLSAVLTPGFAPMEQYSTRGKQGPWSDVYGCAATMYYLVAGRVPPEASERSEDPRIEPPRTFAPDLDPHLSDAIVHGLGFKPEQRPQSARAFADFISGRQCAPAATTGFAPYAPVGISGPAAMSPTALDSSAQRTTVSATEMAPTTIAPAGLPPTEIAKTSIVPTSEAKRGRRILPILAVAAALVLVVATALAWVKPGGTAAAVTKEETRKNDPPPPAPGPGRIGGPAEPATKTVRSPVEIPTATHGQPGTRGRQAGRGGGGGDVNPNVGPLAPPRPNTPVKPPVQPVVPSPTQLLLIMRGQDSEAAETAILGELLRGSGLQPLDVNSIPDQSSVQRALQGDFAGLAALGVELMVLGQLQATVAPASYGSYTGKATLEIRMYRSSVGRVVKSDRFTGGPKNAFSPDDARADATKEAVDAAVLAVRSWLSQ